MIENRLTFIELKRILRPILRLAGLSTIISEYREVFPTDLQSLKEIQDYTQRYNVTYQGFKIFIKGLDEISNNSTYLSMDFKIEKKWYHHFKNPTSKVIEDLKNICLQELKDLFFSKHTTFAYEQKLSYKPSERKEYHFYYDGRSFNSNWSKGQEISTLLIAPSDNEKYYFVEFHYNSSCYCHLNNDIFLKDDWLTHISDVNKYLQKEVDNFFKQSKGPDT